MSGRDDRLIVFSTGLTTCALRLEQAAEVLEGVAAYPVPGAPPYMAEAINVHGRIVPVLDLSVYFGAGQFSGETIIVFDRQVADLALRVRGGVTIVPADRATGEEQGDRPLVERYLALGGERVALLAPGRLVKEIEERLSEETWRNNG